MIFKILKKFYYIITFIPFYLTFKYREKYKKINNLELFNYDRYDIVFKIISLMKNQNKSIQNNIYKQLEFNLKSKKVQINKKQAFNSRNINIFIISYNRLSYLKNMIENLETFNLKKIHIIDNSSTYKPLLNYYSETKYPVHRMDKNYGHLVFWKNKYFRKYMMNYPYIVTDPDLELNTSMPYNFIDILLEILYSYYNINKVGFALKIDDIPNSKILQNVKEWESKYWNYIWQKLILLLHCINQEY